MPGAHHSANTVRCDALLVDTISRSDTYPAVDVREDDVSMGHEATVSRVSEEQLFYLQARGISENEARKLVVFGFLNEIIQQIGVDSIEERLNASIELELTRSNH
jgi:Fe-S cluster assembly protein SufB